MLGKTWRVLGKNPGSQSLSQQSYSLPWCNLPFSGFFCHLKALVLTVRCGLWCVPSNGPFTGVSAWCARGRACSAWPAVGCRRRGQHVWEGCPHACRRCCGSGCQHPAHGARRGVGKLGVELGAVTVIIVRNTSASVEEKRKCLDLPKCLTNLGNRIQNSYGQCSCRATQAQKACLLVALGEESSSKDSE